MVALKLEKQDEAQTSDITKQRLRRWDAALIRKQNMFVRVALQRSSLFGTPQGNNFLLRNL